MTDRSAAIQLERAITHLLISDNDRLRIFGRLLDKRMFLEAVNFTFITTAVELLTEGTLSRLNLLERLESGGVANAEKVYVQQTASITGTSTFDKHYTAWIEGARLRFIDHANEAIEAGELSTTEIIAKRYAVLEQARALGLPDSGISTESALLSQLEWIEYLRGVDGKSIISTGYPELDRNIIGYVPGTLTVIAARPSGGKTTLAAELAIRAQTAGPVLFNTLEMSPARLAFKVAALANKENPMKYDRSFEVASVEFEAIKARVLRQSNLNIRYLAIHDPLILESSIIATKPALFIWDYLQLAQTPARYAGRRTEFIGELARNLQQVCVRTNTPGVVLAQLNRDGADGGAALGNIKDSGVIEEAVDNAVFLERPHFAEQGPDHYKAELTIKKARSGFVGASVELMLNPKTGAFDRWNPTIAAQLVKALGL